MSEPLCSTCGHEHAAHDIGHEGQSIYCLGDHVHVCDCRRFAPSSPPARSRAEAEKAITALLAQHRFRRHTGVQQRDGSVRKQPQGCECWHWEGDETGHRAHVASVLADLMADGPALADAWDEGYSDAVAGDTCRCHGNPYRVADTEGGQ